MIRSKAFIVLIGLGVWTALAVAQNQVQITQGPKVEHVNSDMAVVAWSTNVSAGTTVKYGTDANNLTQSAAMPWGGITHRVTIRNLQPNTTYYFQAVSGQAQGSGTEAMSSVAQFQTPAQNATATTPTTPVAGPSASQPTSPAGQPPVASVQVAAGPIPQHLTDNSASIWWETAQPISLCLRYGTSPTAMNSAAQDSSSGSQQSHRAQLTALKPGTTYYLALVDSTGNQAASGQFTTYPANYAKDKIVDITNGPVIEYISDRQAVIAWSTDQKSSTVVKYGTDANNLSESAEAAWSGGASATHRVTLNNLQPSTRYWFQIQSAQAPGTTSTAANSPKYPFQTVQNASAALRFTSQQ